MRYAALITAVLVSGAGGYLLGARNGQRTASLVPDVTGRATSETGSAAAAAPPTVAGDCQAVKSQLAICMAYHPSESEQDKQLAMCRGSLEACRAPRDTLTDCYEFIDFAPIYDRELGESDPTPETLERAKNMNAEACVRVMSWSRRAALQYGSCLKGSETPPAFKERYRPVAERALVKACNSDALRADAINAMMRRDEDRLRERGHEVRHRVRIGSDGGVLFGSPSSIPDGE